jgi:membrane-bound lytic murein transglycosylase F
MNDAVKPTALRKKGSWSIALLLGATAACGLTSFTPPMKTLDKVRKTGVLRVATINSPTTYFVGPDGEAGFEYDLASGFAQQLGVKLEVEVAASAPEALELVRRGKADVAAAGLAVTPQRAQIFRFSPAVRSVVPQLVYRMGQSKPNSWNTLQGSFSVPEHSVQAELLASLQKRHPTLRWTPTDQGAEDLLEQVADGALDYTVANSDLISINQRYYPKLRVAFDASQSQELAWAFPKEQDDSLSEAAARYISDQRQTELARLLDKHFGHIEAVDHFGAVALATHVQTRLPHYRKSFEAASRRYGLDWRLLAAIAYQESHWDSDAISPTGVRGIMQLTTQTAIHLNVADREDPLQSIAGGARYIRALIDQLPEDIVEPDRTWLALSAYNMGLGHLLDARALTARFGGDPNRWLDVRNNLPLLTQPKWYRETRHGYARGRQAMEYVTNVRSYYDMLVWMTDSGTPAQTVIAGAVTSEPLLLDSAADSVSTVDVPDTVELLRIRTPIL